jgi:hypothetical protein
LGQLEQRQGQERQEFVKRQVELKEDISGFKTGLIWLSPRSSSGLLI